MKRIGIIAAIAAICAFIFWRSPSTVPHPLTVWLTADIRGRLVPCGCFSGQLGGLTRIATLIGPPDAQGTLRLDAGDALEGPEDFHRIELGYIYKAFAKMGYDAANLGHREARLSASELRSLAAQSSVPLLSANLLDAATGAALLKTHIITKRGAWRIAIIGVMDESAEPVGSGLRVEKISTAIGQLLPSLKRDADFLVLLAFTHKDRLHALAKEFPEFSLVLGGKVAEPSQQLAHEGKTAVFQITNESKALGRLALTLDQPGEANVTTGDVQLVTPNIPESAEVAQLAVEYRDEIRATKLAIDDPASDSPDRIPGVRAASTYAGSESCAACHAKANDTWKKSGHSHAFLTLISRKADADPNCIGCHTVGFEKPGGYRREFAATKLTDVGCESCHGPAAKHITRIKAGDLEGARMRKLAAGDCIKCHHGEFSRPFDWAAFWPAIAH